MGNTTREARQELSNKRLGLMAIENMSEEQLIEEGFRKPFFEAPDFSKIQEEKDALYLVRTKRFKMSQVMYFALEESRPEQNFYTFRCNGEKRSKKQRELCKSSARLKHFNVKIREIN